MVRANGVSYSEVESLCDAITFQVVRWVEMVEGR